MNRPSLLALCPSFETYVSAIFMHLQNNIALRTPGRVFLSVFVECVLENLQSGILAMRWHTCQLDLTHTDFDICDDVIKGGCIFWLPEKFVRWVSSEAKKKHWLSLQGILFELHTSTLLDQNKSCLSWVYMQTASQAQNSCALWMQDLPADMLDNPQPHNNRM